MLCRGGGTLIRLGEPFDRCQAFSSIPFKYARLRCRGAPVVMALLGLWCGQRTLLVPSKDFDSLVNDMVRQSSGPSQASE